jgi:hypothetical protein
MVLFLNNLKTKKGSLTVETAVAMPAFIFVILGMAFLIRLVFIFGTIQHAINETSYTLSNYSYLYAKTLKVYNENGKSKEQLDTIINGYSSFAKVLDINSNNKNENLENIANNSIDNPKDEIRSIINMIAGGTYAGIKAKALESVLILFIENCLKTENASGNNRLKSFNVIGGIKGLDFSESKFLEDKKNIEIVVRYKIKPIFLFPDIYLIQRCHSRAWLDGESGSGLNNSEVVTDNVWDLNQLERGKEIQRREGRNLPEFFPVISIYKDGRAVAIKSIDLESVTYRKKANLKAKILEFINDLALFKNGTYMKKKINIKTKEIVIVVPQDSLNDDTKAVLKESEEVAAKLGIKITVKDCYGKKSENKNSKDNEKS